MDITGVQTDAHLRAQVTGNADSIDFTVLESNYELYTLGDVLFRLHRADSDITTEWVSITPTRSEPSEIYFSKID